MTHRRDNLPRPTPHQAQQPPATPPDAPRPAVDAPYGVGVSQPDGAYADTAGLGKGSEAGAYQDVRPWGPQEGVGEDERDAAADEPADPEPVDDIAPPRDPGVPKGDAPPKSRRKIAPTPR